MGIVVVPALKEVPQPNWTYGYVNLLRDNGTGKHSLAFRCPGAQETDVRGVLFLHGDSALHGSLSTVQQYYTLVRSMPWCEVKMEVPV